MSLICPHAGFASLKLRLVFISWNDGGGVQRSKQKQYFIFKCQRLYIEFYWNPVITFIYELSMTFLSLHWGVEWLWQGPSVWLTRPKIFTNWLFTEMWQGAWKGLETVCRHPCWDVFSQVRRPSTALPWQLVTRHSAGKWACMSVQSLIHGHVHKWFLVNLLEWCVPSCQVMWSTHALLRFLIFFFFLNTERAYRAIGSVGLCILKYPRKTCHLVDSCFCSGTVAWWLSFHRDSCCTRHWARALGRGIAHSSKCLSHIGLSVREGTEDG